MDREEQVRQEEQENVSQAEETREEQTADSQAETCGEGGQESADQVESESAEEAADQKSEKKGFFKKKEKDPRDQKIEDLTDQLKRTMAEFDNFRKRTEKEKSAMFEMGAKDILEKILPVVDNFERGLAAIHVDDENLGENVVASELQKGYMYRNSVLRHSMVQVAN